MNSAPGHRALRAGRVSLPNQVYLITTTTRDRVPCFADHDIARSACRCIEGAAWSAGIEPLAWVLMPDHLHFLGALRAGASLGSGVSGIKATIAREANRTRGASGALWARAYHDHALRQEEDLVIAARYIVANPVRAGLVRSVRDYPYWNAVWL